MKRFDSHRNTTRVPQTAALRAASRRRTGAALYATVVLLSLVVTVLAIAAMQLVGLERRTSQSVVDVACAREYSLAAARLALLDVFNDTSWRSRYAHGVETTQVAFASGTVSWSLSDTGDTSLSDDGDDSFEVRGYGRCGDAAWVTSVTVQVVPREIGPIELQGYLNASSVSNGVVNSSHPAGEYFKPFLPSTANFWRVTAIDLYASQDGTAAGSTRIGLYRPGTSGNPGTTLFDEVVLNESALPTSLQMVRVNFTTNAGLDPSVGLSLSLSSTSSSNTMRYGYKTGVTTGSSRYLEGSPAWGTPSSTRSIVYRVYGTYSVRELQIVRGSWKRVAAN